MAKFSCWLRGDIPSKKNGLMPRHGGGKGLCYKSEVKKAMDDLAFQLNCHRFANASFDSHSITNAHLTLTIYPPDLRSDLDGIAATVIDALVKAGIMRNDSMRHLKHVTLCCDPGAPCNHPGAQVHLTGEWIAKAKK